MRTVGQILKEERERKFYTLEEIEKVTKIRVELLEALESDDFKKLPPATFIQGFIKNYGRFLGLETNNLLAIFRREFSEHKNPPRIMNSFSKPLSSPKFHITPTTLISLVIASLVLIFFSYLWFEYRFLVMAPPLNVIYPEDQLSVKEESIEVRGSTEPEALVTINNQPVAVSKEGNFEADLKLSKGTNKLVIVSTSNFKIGRSTQLERTVFLQE